MGIGRSTYYDAGPAPIDETAIVEAISAICDEFECYGWRRVRAELRHRGRIVNHKKIKRLMREHGLQPKFRRRSVATTTSDHDQPIYPNRTKDVTLDGPDRLWVADISYVAIAVGFVYVAVILDAWSRRVVGYAISRSIDARLTDCGSEICCRATKPVAGLRASFRQSEHNRQFPDGLTLTPIDLPARLAPRGARCGLTHIPIDRPCLSPDLSAARERLAVRLCLADACDPRRA